MSPESVRPYPKAAPLPLGKERKKVKACILTENEEALSDLRSKEEKKRKAEEKKRKAEKKKQTASKAKRRKVSKPVVMEEEEEESEVEAAAVVLDDSSEYSEEELEDPLDTAVPYPFQEKEPEVRNLS